MSALPPFNRLRGIPLTIYVAPVGEAVPAVNTVPGGNWVDIGKTDGDQTIDPQGENTYWSDNTQQGDTEAARPHEVIMVGFTLVDMELENVGRIMNDAADVTLAGSTKTLPLQRGANPTPYAMLLRAETLSPEGPYPAIFVFPLGVFDSIEPFTFGQEPRAVLAAEFHVMADPSQPAGKELGWWAANVA